MNTSSGSFSSIFLILASACATGNIVENADLEPTTYVTSPPPKRASDPTPDANGVTTLHGPESLIRLCENLRESSVDPDLGTSVEKERTRSARAERRQRALLGRYVAMLPASGFAFRSYDLESRRLILDPSRPLALGDGVELLPLPQEPSPGFAVGPQLADRLLGQKNSGSLSLRTYFRIAGSQIRREACAWISGGHIVRMEIELLGIALLGSDGAVIARGDTGEFADGSLATPVKNPRVVVQTPRTTEGKDLSAPVVATLTSLGSLALPCYTATLRESPSVRGTLVLGFRVTASGAVESPHAEMSSLGNESLIRCVANQASQLKISGLPGGTRISLPMLFSGKDD